MHNILIITNYSYKFINGGVENYNRIIYSNFCNYNFFELPMLETDDIDDNIDFSNVKIINKNFTNLSRQYIYIYIEEIIKKYNIDKIIFSGDYFFDKKFLKKYSDKIFFIQHTTPYHYFPKLFFSAEKKEYIPIFSNRNFFIRNIYRIIWTLLNLSRFKFNNFFKYVDNLIVFTEFDKNVIEKKYHNKNFFIISPPSKYNSTGSTSKKEYDFITVSRLEKIDINIYNKILNKFNYKKFLLISDVDDNHQLFNFKNLEIKRPTDDEKLKLYYKSSKYLLLPTIKEGCPLVALESLSLKVPIILWNKYPSSKWFFDEWKVGEIIDKNDNCIVKINELLMFNYDDLVNNATFFANKYLSINNFVEKWKEILVY